MAVVFHHLPRDMAGDAQHRRLWFTSLEQFCDALTPKIMEPQPSQSGGPCEITPRGTPCPLRPCLVNVAVFAGRKHVELRPRNSKFGRPLKENPESEHCVRIQRETPLARFALAIGEAPSLLRTSQCLTTEDPIGRLRGPRCLRRSAQPRK